MPVMPQSEVVNTRLVKSRKTFTSDAATFGRFGKILMTPFFSISTMKFVPGYAPRYIGRLKVRFV